MRSKRLDVKIRIILFLICTIGILYISMRLFSSSQEGFQTDMAHGCVYDTTTFPGIQGWFCKTEASAALIQSDSNIVLRPIDQVCYLTPNPDNATSNYYTCYRRPPTNNFSALEGHYYDLPFNEDTTPNDIITDIKGVCNDFTTEGKKLEHSISTGVNYQSSILGVSKQITVDTSNLQTISTTYCPKGVTDPKIVSFCTTLNTGIDVFNNLPLTYNGTPYGLNYMSNQVTSLMISLSNLSTTGLQVPYKGFNC
jgi:hypothetical protein